MKDLINRWIKSEDAANRKQFRGKTINTRFQGLWQPERNQAKFMLVATVPVLAISPFVSKWSDASLVERAALLVTGTWAVVVTCGGTFLAIRSIYRGVKKPGG
ncbi:hypothetical protein WBQ88_05980 [Sphingopyxis sp. CCNWLW253]|uniref:hypothetical protein n=1 Tax=unclassified Sphingopyxis TaxID=2614943 RepID=UPI003012D2E3